MEDVKLYIETMKRVADIFNKNEIRYALAGGVVSELRTGEIRTHKDIDFAVFENDIPQIVELLKQNSIKSKEQIVAGTENWVDTTEHNLTAVDNKTGTNIGFFIYSNQQEEYNEIGELVSKAGFVRKTIMDYQGVNITLRERISNDLEKYLFSKERYEELDGVKINVQPLAYIMTLKARNMRQKDRADLVHTTQLLNNDEIEEYNKYKGSILNIQYTAQAGDNAKEGNVDEVKRLIDITNKQKDQSDIEFEN